jgi:hypothetical protein
MLGYVMRTTAAFLLTVALCGCASQADLQQQRMKTSLDSFINLPITAVVAERGPPTAVVDLGKNEKMFQWLLTSQSPAVAVPINGIIVTRPSQQLECRINFTAVTEKANPTLADWRVNAWQSAGAC